MSIVIPTHNRRERLRRTLDALATVTRPPGGLEVVVVMDRCTDGTDAMLQRLHPPFPLRALALAGQGGPAAARNAGAAAAQGSLLLFMDDDVEPSPGFVAAHVAAHAAPDAVVIGALSPALDGQAGFFRIALRRWWEDMFDRMRRPGHRFCAFDLLSGNVSLPAALFHRAGGFDPTFTCHEDYELGVRLMRLGARFTFAEAAVARHHEATDLRGALQRKFEEGRADVALGHKHPEIIPELPLHRLWELRSRRARAVRRLAFLAPAATGVTTRAGLVALWVLERVRARRLWRRVLNDLLTYWYWRGAAGALGSPAALARFATARSGDASGAEEVLIDLRDGVATAEASLDRLRPAAARLVYGPHPVGRLPARPGAEALAGRHLRPLLEGALAAPLLDAMARAGAVPADLDATRLRALCRAVPARPTSDAEPATRS
ncbi:MAG: glycosyltransferase [Armatimonadota bacterium]|nr:glycosyltransferase [Armatimonadota bacterium]MDR7421393.1 glycosyltransferase [Armatimonadota bacterium]MDR7453911.1 glycosyltransferase [Armatimonadota bacterium]MDR7456669.1 glycosyltransferase [Armatimonadota bacterium]MDR7495736.1 glycosyltransferase [Armatimonadota bacterium]